MSKMQLNSHLCLPLSRQLRGTGLHQLFGVGALPCVHGEMPPRWISEQRHCCWGDPWWGLHLVPVPGGSRGAPGPPKAPISHHRRGISREAPGGLEAGEGIGLLSIESSAPVMLILPSNDYQQLIKPYPKEEPKPSAASSSQVQPLEGAGQGFGEGWMEPAQENTTRSSGSGAAACGEADPQACCKQRPRLFRCK